MRRACCLCSGRVLYLPEPPAAFVMAGYNPAKIIGNLVNIC